MDHTPLDHLLADVTSLNGEDSPFRVKAKDGNRVVGLGKIS